MPTLLTDPPVVRHRWAALAALCLASLMVMMDNTIVNVALPSIAADLDSGISGLQWVVDGYTLAFAGLLITGGHLGDRFGRRRMLITGVIGFALVSIPAALSSSLGALVATRVGLGVCAALVFPATLALLTVVFTDAKERATAFGAWAATTGVSVAIGPVLGGWLMEHYSWASVFWINLPLAAAVLLAVFALVPSGGRDHSGRFDTLGLALSIAAMTLLVYSVIEGPHHGWTDPRTLGGIGLALALAALFVRHELRTPAPILDVRVFSNRMFSGAALQISLAFFALFGFIFLITQYFQAVKGYGTLSAGLHTLPFAIVMAVMSPLAMVLTGRFGVARVAATGSLLMATGFAMVLITDANSSYWGLIVWSMSLMAAGLGLISGPCTHVVMNALPPAQAGAGAAVNDTTREFGGTMGVAVLGSVLTSIYTARIGDAAVVDLLPDSARAAMNSSVMGALEVARQAPEQLRAPILDAARDAFVAGLHQSVWAAVIATAVAAPICAWLLRERKMPLATPDATDVYGLRHSSEV
ncbi:MFS transporter [Williamsia sp. CHRR-6]|uniref:MFS transporter n=1 Tax=Williamsia sp. CHRR-6 TaxID=2835871 RepID=UPI001BDA6F03|nr:MFS transporter [Williamsia sp. CHRR-6]MBT0566294.1 MFS transporter [Williamsia sp. CHRR-6]